MNDKGSIDNPFEVRLKGNNITSSRVLMLYKTKEEIVTAYKDVMFWAWKC